MSNFTDFIGGGGSASYPTIFLSKSQTWVPPQDGNICIHVIGAGGSGSAWNSSNISSGAAGGYCKKNSLAVTTSGSFTVVVGAGGAPVFNSQTGQAGGATTVAGTGLSSTLTANGGSGGKYGIPSVAGTASGGNVNYTGGASAVTNSGGAVGLTGTGNAGKAYSSLFAGGDCDVIGDLWSSSFGEISGSLGPKGIETNSNAQYAPNPTPLDAGPFAGGAFIRQGRTTQWGYSSAGAATIGGGGGSNDNSGGANNSISGRGGEGIVVIQYIP